MDCVAKFAHLAELYHVDGFATTLAGDFDAASVVCTKPSEPKKQNRNLHQLSAQEPSLVTAIRAGNVGNLVAAIQFAEFYDAFYAEDGDGGNVPVVDELVMAAQARVAGM